MLNLRIILVKWLKKAKLRDGNHNVGLHCTETMSFYYRGFTLGYIEDNRVMLKYPATLKPNEWPSLIEKECLLAADPKFFVKLRKALRNGMTAINSASINTGHSDYPRGPGGRQQSTAKE